MNHTGNPHMQRHRLRKGHAVSTMLRLLPLVLCLIPSSGSCLPPIRLVLIDAKTTAAYGPLPWTRERHARIVSKLDAAGANVIVLRFYYRDDRGDPGDHALWTR